MKGFFTATALLFFFSSCKESGVQIAKPSTFVKYFSDGNQDDAVDVIQTSDKGFLILSHSVNSSTGHGWISLTKTDLSGNSMGDIKPIISSNSLSDLRPSNVVAIKDNAGNDTGYVIVGTLLNSSFGAELFVARIKPDGTLIDSISYNRNKGGDAASFRNKVGDYVMGKGVAQSTNQTNDFFVVGQVVQADLVSPPLDKTGKPVDDMFFAQINGNTLDTVFTRTYGAGTSSLANRLFLDFGQTDAYWGGTRTDANGNGIHMRFTKSGFNSQNTAFDMTYPIGDISSSTLGNDISPYGYGFVIIGNDQAKTQIVLASLGTVGNEISPILHLPTDNSKIIQISGNSVCSTLDGGLLVLGTNAVDAQGTNTDYYLNKLDAFGTTIWEKNHGGQYPDVGVRVLQSSDGGYVVLGTTTLANVKTVFLMKTDSQGNIQ